MKDGRKIPWFFTFEISATRRQPTCHFLPPGTGEFQGLPVDGGDEGGLDLQPDAVLHEESLGVDDGVEDGDQHQGDDEQVAPPGRFVALNISEGR